MTIAFAVHKPTEMVFSECFSCWLPFLQSVGIILMKETDKLLQERRGYFWVAACISACEIDFAYVFYR